MEVLLAQSSKGCACAGNGISFSKPIISSDKLTPWLISAPITRLEACMHCYKVKAHCKMLLGATTCHKCADNRAECVL